MGKKFRQVYSHYWWNHEILTLVSCYFNYTIAALRQISNFILYSLWQQCAAMVAFLPFATRDVCMYEFQLRSFYWQSICYKIITFFIYMAIILVILMITVQMHYYGGIIVACHQRDEHITNARNERNIYTREMREWNKKKILRLV